LLRSRIIKYHIYRSSTREAPSKYEVLVARHDCADGEVTVRIRDGRSVGV
jgi:hypothetical protein